MEKIHTKLKTVFHFQKQRISFDYFLVFVCAILVVEEQP